MFDIYYHNALIAYNQYYEDINNYCKYKQGMNRVDNREQIILDIFSKYNIYNTRVINDCINYYHCCKKYFN